MKILVAISGGLDSAASVLLLKRMGFDNIEALFIDMQGDCNSVANAKKVADQLKIKLHISHLKFDFKNKVVGHFLNQLDSGQTPSMCAFCNPHFKFKTLIEFATKHNYDKVATGHYAQIELFNNRLHIKQGVDKVKDQSYFLWGLKEDQLRKIIFPLGALHKAEVKEILKQSGYNEIAARRESMSLCFIGKDSSYVDFVKEHCSVRKGDVIEANGNKVGTHNGYQLYTTGQKRGFELENPNEIYEVVEIISSKNLLVASKHPQDLYSGSFIVGELNIIDEELFFSSQRLRVCVRGLGRNPEGFCRVEKDGVNVKVQLDNPAWALAKGQSAVFYIEDLVIGGGVII